jgi:hypothetical protein
MDKSYQENLKSGMSIGMAKYKREDNMALPFDELDPCCQKEIVNQNHHARVGAALRRTDRSEYRADARNKSFKTAASLRKKLCLRCDFCEEASDYELLAQIRAKKAQVFGEEQELFEEEEGNDADKRIENEEDLQEAKITINPSRNGGDQDTDTDDDDEFLLSCAEVMTPNAKLIMQARNFASQSVDFFTDLGYGEHLEEGVMHLTQLLEAKHHALVHMFDAKSLWSAHMDLCLENVARKHFGTMFRRVAHNEETIYYLRSFLTNNNADSDAIKSLDVAQSNTPCILLFKEGQLVQCIKDFLPFGNVEDGIYESDLLSFLSHSHVLHIENTNQAVMEHFVETRTRMNGATGDTIVDVDEATLDADHSYCGVPGCNRDFVHSHIGQGDSVVKDESEGGMEAFEAGVFHRL